VSPWTAQRWGGLVGALCAVAGVVWLRTRAVPCPGAVTIEFHPPLADPGRYQFELLGVGSKPCTFSVPLPTVSADSNTGACGMARELRSQVRDGEVSIAALTFAAAPAHFSLRVKRDQELIYDAPLEPKYAHYETTRAENSRFCGERARVVPPCLRGSSECQPFTARCAGPEGCPNGLSCCLTAEWGRDFGAKAASECAPKNSCFAHFGLLACHTDADCPKDLRCAAWTAAADFAGALSTCQSR
jgi:hypothetical protein